MIDKCPECKVKIDVLPIQESEPQSTSMGSTMSTTVTYDLNATYPPSSKTYKCSNPKCWVTKITESWK